MVAVRRLHTRLIASSARSVQVKHDITALATKGDLTFAAHGTTITECKRVHK
jgi:hypothetical protein